MSTTGSKDQDLANNTRAEERLGKRTKTALARRGPTGPRTQRGKMKSRYNALKHGIFANVVLRQSVLREKQEDYENLLQSFRENLQPEGGLEEFLVEKLAQIAWRKGRAVRAESAIIRKQTEFLRQDHGRQLKDASEGDSFQLARFAGIARKGNPYLLQRSLRVLEVLKATIEERGFESESDERLLQLLYGESGAVDGLYLQYRIWADHANEVPQDSPEHKNVVGEYKQGFLALIDIEVERIRHEIRDFKAREEVEGSLKEESLAIPQGKELDRLLRYEARLEGGFDRTLQQLERLQRVRRGEAVPPTIKVDIAR